jgi:ABC-type phosphate/phosphonate transport system substrate-binding protein
LARAALRAAGVNPDTDIKPRFSGNHTQVLIDLMHGDCDAAGTYSGGYLAADRAGVPVSRTRTLAISGRSPQDVVVASSTCSELDRTLMQQALLSIDPKHDVGSEALGSLERISGFTLPRIAEYDALLPAYRAEGQL